MTRHSNAGDVASDIRDLSNQITQAVHQATAQWTAELQAQVQRNASGRPGPNAPTGDYRRSINRDVTSTSNRIVGRVGTNKSQGRRLEFGFRGVDSIGRRFNQPAYPHFGPALDAIGPKYAAAIAALADPTTSASASKAVGGDAT